MHQTSPVTTVEDLINDPNFNPNDWYGYVYMTSFLNLNKSYIGKKVFNFKTNKKLGKKEIAALPTTPGRKPAKKLVIKESDWKTYYGSEKEVIALSQSEPKDKIIRVVLHLCKTKKQLSYYETKTLFQYEVLEHPDRYFNGNIAGSYFRKDLV